MPAAAVIPTPRVSTVDAAVKKSVVVGWNKMAQMDVAWVTVAGGADGEHGIAGREMKWPRPWWTERGEGDVLVRV